MSNSENSNEKTCVFCGQSCDGMARIKDAKGNYAHKSCAQIQQAKQEAKKAALAAQPEIEPLDLSPEEEPEMAAFLDDLPSSSEPSAGIRAACPGCGTSVSSDSLICVSCGCNIKTGRSKKTKDKKARSSGSGTKLAAKAGAFTLAPILPIIGASIGGFIGAILWMVVQAFTGYEIGLLAAGVGAMCGIGASLFTRGGNAWAGGVAVVVALISVFMGKILIATLFIAGADFMKEELQAQMMEPRTLESITEDDIYSDLVYEFVDVYIADESYWPYDYSQDIIDKTHALWEAMDPEDQLDFKEQLVTLINLDIQEFNAELEDELALFDEFSLSDLFSFFDILWALFAIGAAWQFGSGED